jgi:hypothetical protein
MSIILQAISRLSAASLRGPALLLQDSRASGKHVQP